MNPKNVVILGATGAVGLEMIRVLEDRDFPVRKLRLLASKRSAGRFLKFKNERVRVEAVSSNSFDGMEIGLFSAGSAVSKAYAPVAASKGCVVIDNTSAFRMDKKTPLVVPEVNPHALRGHHGIIANPNCSTIQLVVAVKPLHDIARAKRIVVTTFQSVSGAGLRAEKELADESLAVLSGRKYNRKIFPYQIAFNAIPQIPQSDAFMKDGFTVEERKMMDETLKILEDRNIDVCATCVRVPVFRCHSESVNVEFARPIPVQAAREALASAEGVVLLDEPQNQLYPLATTAAGLDATFVGRVRKDPSAKNAIAFWVVSDNLRKGAALNAVQIAEIL